MIIVFFLQQKTALQRGLRWDPEHAHWGDPDKLRGWSGAGLREFAQRLLLMDEGGKAIFSAVRGDRDLKKMSSGLLLTQSHELVLKAVGGKQFTETEGDM